MHSYQWDVEKGHIVTGGYQNSRILICWNSTNASEIPAETYNLGTSTALIVRKINLWERIFRWLTR
jgi:hypothetical protein